MITSSGNARLPARPLGDGARASRIRAICVVVSLVLLVGVPPGLTPRAVAAPRMFTVAVHELEPFVMTVGTTRSGFTIDLLEAVAKRADWALRYLDEKNVDGQLGAVAAGRADAAATAIEITAARAKDFKFSQPILASGMQILVPAGQISRSPPGFSVFLELLFSKTMLIWLGTAMLLSVIPAHIIWLSERRHRNPMVPKSYFAGVIRSFGWTLGMLVGQPTTAVSRYAIGRSLGVLWAFVGIIFVAYYTATLTANVTVDKIDSKISTPADLVGKRVCTVADTQSLAYLISIGVIADAVAKIEDCYSGLRDGKLDAVAFDAAVLRYFAAHEGAGVSQVVGTIFEAEDYGVAFPAEGDLNREFDEALLSIREDGNFDLIKQKWFGLGTPDSTG